MPPSLPTPLSSASNQFDASLLWRSWLVCVTDSTLEMWTVDMWGRSRFVFSKAAPVLKQRKRPKAALFCSHSFFSSQLENKPMSCHLIIKPAVGPTSMMENSLHRTVKSRGFQHGGCGTFCWTIIFSSHKFESLWTYIVSDQVCLWNGVTAALLTLPWHASYINRNIWT